MDPDLQDSTCVCPEMTCIDGMTVNPETDDLEECPRCQGIGYIPCDDVQEGEWRKTMAEQRAGIMVPYFE